MTQGKLEKLRNLFRRTRTISQSASTTAATQALSLRDRLKHSRSMPLQSQSGTTREFKASKSMYRKKGPIKRTEMALVDQVACDSEKKLSKKNRVRSATKQNDTDLSDDDDDESFAALDNKTLDEFPIPPHAITTPDFPPRSRHASESVPYPSGDDLLILPPHPVYERWLQEQHDEQERMRRQPRRQRSHSRSCSNASFSRPTTSAYPELARSYESHSLEHSRTYTSMSRSKTHPQGAWPTFQTLHSNNSMRTLHSQPRLTPGHIAQRAVLRQASSPAIHHSATSQAPSALPNYSPYHPDVLRVVRHGGPQSYERPRYQSSSSSRRPGTAF